MRDLAQVAEHIHDVNEIEVLEGPAQRNEPVRRIANGVAQSVRFDCVWRPNDLPPRSARPDPQLQDARAAAVSAYASQTRRHARPS
jgi:hypothetical protein